MDIYANIKGKWVFLNDKYVISGQPPEDAFENITSDKDYLKATNNFVEIAKRDSNEKYYIHYSNLQAEMGVNRHWGFSDKSII